MRGVITCVSSQEKQMEFKERFKMEAPFQFGADSCK